ncbi:MAG: hypothetical protein ACI37R_00975 [Candidatus Avigastranaerophilus sp.]
MIIKDKNYFYNTEFAQKRNEESTGVSQLCFNSKSLINFKGSEAIKNTVLAEISFKQKMNMSGSKNGLTVCEADKKSIAGIITERYCLDNNYYDIPQKDIDWDIKRFLSYIKTAADVKFAKAALLKQTGGKNLYTCTEITDMLCRLGEDGVTDTTVEIIEKSDEKLTADILSVLETLKKENPEKYYFLIKSQYLMRYLCNSFANQNQNNLIFTSDASFLPKLEEACGFVSLNNASENNFARLTDLYLSDKTAYEYAVSSPFLGSYFISSAAFSSSKNLGVNELNEIEKAYRENTSSNRYLKMYVMDSDFFRYDNELSEYISQFRTDGDITVFRGERDTGMFENVSLKDSKLSMRIREINEANKTVTSKEKITPNSFTYRKNKLDTISLYDYINSKSELNLSDAMLMAKYADDDFVNDVLSKIKMCTIKDCRFKSVSFSESFADYWKNVLNDKNTATVKEKLTIKKGTEGVFCSGAATQSEFILNNKPKLFEYQSAVYDRKTDTFVLEAVVHNI